MFLNYALFVEDFQKVFNYQVVEAKEDNTHNVITYTKGELSWKEKIKGSFHFTR